MEICSANKLRPRTVVASVRWHFEITCAGSQELVFLAALSKLSWEGSQQVLHPQSWKVLCELHDATFSAWQHDSWINFWLMFPQQIQSIQDKHALGATAAQVEKLQEQLASLKRDLAAANAGGTESTEPARASSRVQSTAKSSSGPARGVYSSMSKNELMREVRKQKEQHRKQIRYIVLLRKWRTSIANSKPYLKTYQKAEHNFWKYLLKRIKSSNL